MRFHQAQKSPILEVLSKNEYFQFLCAKEAKILLNE